jgi:hypothetical protein
MTAELGLLVRIRNKSEIHYIRCYLLIFVNAADKLG